MKNFRPGQKVVFSVERLRVPYKVYREHHYKYCLPAEGEVVTIVKDSPSNPGHWIIREYLLNHYGKEQCINEKVLFPIEEIHARFTEKILAGIEKSIYKIPA